MPARGYQKGRSDHKEPVPRSVRTHISDAEFEALRVAASSRSLTLSRLLRSLVRSFVAGERLALPRAKGPSQEAVRELARIGNNLNQLTHQSHLLRLHLLEAETKTVLKALLEAIDRFA